MRDPARPRGCWERTCRGCTTAGAARFADCAGGYTTRALLALANRVGPLLVRPLALEGAAQIPCPGRNSLVKGGRPALLGSCDSRRCEYIQLPNAAQAVGDCQPNGLFVFAGCVAGSVCLIDSNCSFASSDGLALPTSAAPAAGLARTWRSPRVSACRNARKSWPSVCASLSLTTSTSSL